MVVVIFRSRLRADANTTELEALGARMYGLASQMPGFVSYKDFCAADGENLSLVEFEDEASLLAWRQQPEHVQGQERGRREFFGHYHIQVCTPYRDYGFSLPADGQPPG